jgi:hypothetical protein
MTRKNRIALQVLPLIAVLLLAATASYGQTSSTPPVVGSMLGQVAFKQNCGYLSGVGSGVGIGITFDGKNLWYSCYNSKLATVSGTDSTPNPNDLYKADPMTGAVLAAYDIQGGTGAIAYDQKRNVIWAAEGDGCNDVAQWGCDNQVKVIQIPLDTNQNVIIPTCATPPCPPAQLFTVAFSVPEAYGAPITSTGSTQNIVDGLAIDGATDTLYIHYDFATDIATYNATTGAFLGFIPESPGIPAGTQIISNPYGFGCVVSGLAIGGATLFQASDYCDHVWAVDKTTQAAGIDFDFTSSVSPFSNFDDKTLTCDPKTFGNAGDAVWVKEPYDPQTAFAFTIPTCSCGIGGQPAKGNCKPKKK